MADFILFGQEFSISESYIRDYKMNEIRDGVIMKAKKEFYSWYNKRSGIEEVLKKYLDVAVEIVDIHALTPLFESLGTFDIYDISNDNYINQCVDCSSIDNAYDMILSELEKIVDDQNEMREYRAARKAYRGRMVGGGFGLSGAIKGAVKAGAINATTGLAHSAVNAIGNMGSAIAASSQKTSLYNNNRTKETLCIGVLRTIFSTFENHKKLVNQYDRYYFEDGFDKDKAEALFENAMKNPNKREMLLLESVINYPAENTLSYIFTHYKGERKNVYKIGEVFNLDFGKYIEEAFAASYTNEVKLSEQKVAEVKNDIILTMKEFGIESSDTLNQINYDELIRIAKKYLETSTDLNVQQILDKFNKYDAPISQKKQVVHEKGIWQLARKYSVTYTTEEIENILKGYYTANAQKNERDAQNAKKKIIEIMDVLNVKTSATFDRLEKDCIARICENLENADEETCYLIRDKITNYDALEKNKKEYFDQVQKRVEVIWTKEDSEIFDNVYLNTDIYNQNEIDSAIEFIKQKGRTSNAERYIVALQSCNETNIRKAKKFQKRSTKLSNAIGILLLIIGILGFFVLPTFAVIAIPGIMFMIRYHNLKKNWNILTIDGGRIHSSIMLNNSENATNESNGPTFFGDKEEVKEEKDNFSTGEKTSELLDAKKMYCVFCGKQIETTTKFCNFCGKKVYVKEDKN